MVGLSALPSREALNEPEKDGWRDSLLPHLLEVGETAPAPLPGGLVREVHKGLQTTYETEWTSTKAHTCNTRTVM